MSGCMLFCCKVTFRGDMPLHSFTWVMMLLMISDYYSLQRLWIYSLCWRPAVLLHHFVLNGGAGGLGIQLMYHFSDKFAGTPGHIVCHCSGKFMEMASHIITVVASWCWCQATLSLWWQVDVDVRPHYHCGGWCQATLLLWWRTDVDVRPHITVVASWCRCSATLSLWWQVDGDVRPHYHYGGNLMEMSGHIITMVAILWRCQATLSLWWQSDGDVRPHYHCGGNVWQIRPSIIVMTVMGGTSGHTIYYVTGSTSGHIIYYVRGHFRPHYLFCQRW